MAKKQTEIPLEGAGVAPVRIPEVDQAAAKFFKIKEQRCKLTAKETAAKDELITTLHEHEEKIGRNAEGILRYRFDGDDDEIMVQLSPAGEEKLSVKVIKEDGDGSE